MISMASASNTRANRQAEAFVSRSYVSRTPLTATFPTRVSDCLRAVAETTDEQAAQLAVQAAGARLAWAERFRRRPGWPRHRAALARARARCGAARSTRSGPAVHQGQD